MLYGGYIIMLRLLHDNQHIDHDFEIADRYCGSRLIFLDVIFEKWKTQNTLFLVIKNRKFREKIIIKKLNETKKW